MSPQETAELKAIFRVAFRAAIDEMGVDAFKRTSFFGSNDPAFVASRHIGISKAA